jgi:ureidoglycolate hydrolase
MPEDLMLRVEPLSAGAFEPFGRVIETPSRTQDAEGPGWRWWAETTALRGDERPWTVGYLDLAPAPPPRFDWAERHMRSPEAVVPISGSCLLYAAPPEHPDEPDRLPPLDAFRVFRLVPGTGVVMDPAVWHGAPVPTEAAKAIVLLLEGTGRTDVTKVPFADTPVMIQEA